MESQPYIAGVGLPVPGRHGAVSCVVDDASWTLLAGLDDEILFHPDLFPVLRVLPTLIVEGDLRDAIADLVLNGFDV